MIFGFSDTSDYHMFISKTIEGRPPRRLRRTRSEGEECEGGSLPIRNMPMTSERRINRQQLRTVVFPYGQRHFFPLRIDSTSKFFHNRILVHIASSAVEKTESLGPDRGATSQLTPYNPSEDSFPLCSISILVPQQIVLRIQTLCSFGLGLLI